MFEILRYEFVTRARRLSTWVYALILFALALLWFMAAGGFFQGANISFGSGKLFVNSPFVIATSTGVLSLFGTVILAAIMGRAVQQDAEYRTEAFLFTSPITRGQYLGGRFLGSFGVAVLIFVCMVPGFFIASLLPGMDAARFGPNHASAYLWPLLTVLLPNMLLVGTLFFTLAGLTRRMLPVYIGAVVMLLGWLLATQLLRDIDNKTLASLLDPYGQIAAGRLTEYWTVDDRNTRLTPLEGAFLWNRLLWLGVSLAIAGVCFWRFSFTAADTGSARRWFGRKGNATTAEEPMAAAPQAFDLHASVSKPGWSLLPHLVWLQLRATIRNVYFAALVVAGLLFMVLAQTTSGAIYGTSTWPVTAQIMQLVSGSFTLFMLVIITFYAGEIVWRERESRLDQIVDATPMPTWLGMTSKFIALLAIPALLQALLMICGMLLQLGKGYTHLQPLLWVHQLFGLDLVDYWIVCALALTLHSVLNQKYLAHFAMILYYIAQVASSGLGLEDRLYKFGSTPSVTYSDMNGFGHFLWPLRVFQSYWTAAAVLLLAIGYLAWTRGTVTGWRERVEIARSRLSLPLIGTMAVALLAFVSIGAYIAWNTHYLNPFRPEYVQQSIQADYERRFKGYERDPIPTITDVAVSVDLFPKVQGLRAKGRYLLVNNTDRPIENLLISTSNDQHLVFRLLKFDRPGEIVERAFDDDVMRWQFAEPIPPGASAQLDFDLEVQTRGFQQGSSNTNIVANGTFIANYAFMPQLGYQRGNELSRDQDRRKFGLGERARMADRDDPVGLQQTVFGPSGSWVKYRGEVSTDAGQIAISPGYVSKQWTSDDGRVHAAYAMDVPIMNFYAFQSAAYAVHHGEWREVPIDIYYQPGHEFNLDAMVSGAQASFDFCSAAFGPYQYRQLRILEFPRYQTFAQSFPNTVPFSEGIGFIARVKPDDPHDIDYPFYVTAHEVAHQWWGHQVVAADVQGSTMIIESFAQYSALMAMKQHFGAARMHRFLSYELNRYLTGRGFEQKKEQPLARVENQQYIHYAKGSLVMYALQDYLGEDVVNGVLKKFHDEYAFKGPPYPNTTRFLQLLREVVPADRAYIVDDWFETITLYDNRARAAHARALEGGKWEVTIDVSAAKLRADDLGKEQPVPLADIIEIGVLDENDDPILLEKHRIDTPDASFKVIVDRKPVKAGIDPINLLIDRKPSDNVMPVTID
ncbi:M1 family aminopeptidase [soil metagenome]